MSRTYLADYVGARGRAAPSDIRRLSPLRWQIQPKVDGMYVHLHLDRHGRCERVLSRTGGPVSRGLVGHLLGECLGHPGAVLCGELEAHTEAGDRAAETRGFRMVWLFDALRDVGGEYIARRPYRERRAHLWRGYVWAESRRPRAWSDDATGRAHSAADGRFCRRVPRGTGLACVVPQRPPRAVDEIWDRAVSGVLEGAVAVAQDAPAGARRSKRKVKPTSEIDCHVVSVGRGAVKLLWAPAATVFATKAPAGLSLAVGSLVRVRHDGFYERTGEPRFARVVQQRADM